MHYISIQSESMTTIQVRIDEKTKQAAKKVLDSLGIDMSTAIKAYFKQISIHQGLPFQLVTENGLTPTEERVVVKRAQEARQGKGVSKYMTANELIKHLDAL